MYVSDVVSPDVKLAGKSVLTSSKLSGLCIGVACCDGVLLTSVRPKREPIRNSESVEMPGDESERVNLIERTRRLDLGSPLSFGKCIFKLEKDVHVAVSGWQADSAYLVRRLQEVCTRHRKRFGTPIDARQLAEETSTLLYTFSTEESGTRPLVVSVLVGGTISMDSVPHHALEMVIDPNGGDKTYSLRRTSRLTEACLFKVDTAGALEEISAGVTGSLNSEDLYLSKKFETEEKTEAEAGVRESSERENASDEGTEEISDSMITVDILKYLRSSEWHQETIHRALGIIREKYDVIDNNL